ncbi:lasso RiPP family leader peptide-containing protein [Saccharothrix sp. AJ9571]|nr:lasso RiPP family leader peptide-containing protein [Saccharothrix sp. AJ9571]
MNEEMMAAPYEPPALVELGEFSEDTLGGFMSITTDSYIGFGPDY